MPQVVWTKADLNEAVKQGFPGQFLWGQSELHISAKVTGLDSGVTIKEPWIKVGGTWYEGSEVDLFPFDLIAGPNTIEYWGKDNKGKITTSKTTVTLGAYAEPYIRNFVITQTDSNGNPNEKGSHMKLLIEGWVDAVGGKNTKKIVIEYKKSAQSEYTKKTITPSNWTFSEKVLIPAEHDISYNVRIILSDKLHEYVAVNNTGIPVISRLAGGNGVTFFSEAKKDGFNVNHNHIRLKGFPLKSFHMENPSAILPMKNKWRIKCFTDNEVEMEKTFEVVLKNANWKQQGNVYYQLGDYWSFPYSFQTVPIMETIVTEESGYIWYTQETPSTLSTNKVWLYIPKPPGKDILARITFRAKGLLKAQYIGYDSYNWNKW